MEVSDLSDRGSQKTTEDGRNDIKIPGEVYRESKRDLDSSILWNTNFTQNSGAKELKPHETEEMGFDVSTEETRHT
ncbi:hypothetical protein AYI68_g8185 [Smittium mucronatum]|uniref:Uncharacterized protein n=1 Tax=Smittium mucronatum TaxID=133383 RepID=A0A1R0GLM4_9FUNG|nr:hypothetical protein AYI68_g8185 [Smittium mucronatum]